MDLTRRQFTQGAAALAAAGSAPMAFAADTLKIGYVSPQTGPLAPFGEADERLRAAGAGIGAFFTPTGFGTELAKGKETREIGGRQHVLEYPIHGDVTLIKAEQGDRWGNLTYRKAARNFGPVMAMASRRTVASVYEILPPGGLDPEAIVTPGIFVHHVVQVPRTATQGGGFRKAA